MDKNIIQDSIEEIKEITELFYQEKKDEAFGRLDKAIGNMMTVENAVSFSALCHAKECFVELAKHWPDPCFIKPV